MVDNNTIDNINSNSESDTSMDNDSSKASGTNNQNSECENINLITGMCIDSDSSNENKNVNSGLKFTAGYLSEILHDITDKGNIDVIRPIESTGWSQLSSGTARCAINLIDQAYCWGYNGSGQLGNNSIIDSLIPVAVDTSGVLNGKTIKSISAGIEYTCAIASDNQAYCWGSNSAGQLGDNSTVDSSIPVAVDTSGVLSGKTIKSISAGLEYACAIASDNQAYCWGSNSAGQLGNNSTTDSLTPVAVDTSDVLNGKTIKSVITNDSHTCAIASDNQAYCWGSNSSGQLGNNSTTDSLTPVAVDTSDVLNGKTINVIGAGGSNTCAVASDNQAYCWGANDAGQLGNNSTIDSLVPVAVNTSGVLSGKTIKSISVGDIHACVIASDDQAYCWGINSDGQLGNNDIYDYSSLPVAVNTSGLLNGKTIKKISAGFEKTCVIASDDQAYCWGLNNSGELGNGSATKSSVPVAVDNSNLLYNKTTKSISAGWNHTCVIASDNQAYCWGVNHDGQLGNNSTTDSSVPIAVYTSGVLNGKTLKSISVGNIHTCAIASDNQAYCWGSNGFGQLGNNSTTDSSVPVAVDTSGVLSGKTIKAISASTSGVYTCAIASDDQAYCWGLWGVGSNDRSSVPVAVDTSGVLNGKTLKSISVGNSYACAIASDDQAYCWGGNYSGQLGNNTTNSSAPVAVDLSGVLNGKTIKSISAGNSSTCAIASDNQAYCWGYNGSGQLGDNSTTNSLTPIAVDTSGVLNSKTLKSISVGYTYTCAIASDDQAYCWGGNYSGQLGNNNTTDSLTPVAVYTSGVLNGKNIQYITAGYEHTCAIVSDNQAYCWGNNYDSQLGVNNSIISIAHALMPVQVTYPKS